MVKIFGHTAGKGYFCNVYAIHLSTMSLFPHIALACALAAAPTVSRAAVSATDSTFSATDSTLTSSDSIATAAVAPHVRPLMRDVFATMPEALAPLVSRNNRLDCIDFIENDMEARVRNAIDDYVTLEALTADYARFRTSTSAFMELRLISDSVVCVVRTVEAGRDSLAVADSRVAFFTPAWEPLPTERFYRRPPIEAFLAKDASQLTDAERRVVAALRYFCPMQVTLASADGTLTVIPQTGDLEPELRDAARGVVRSVSVAAHGR